jgi:hypothetical protein
VEMKAISGTRSSAITHREIVEEGGDVLSSEGEIIRATDEKELGLVSQIR